MRSALARFGAGNGPALLLCLAFLAFVAPLLESLNYNFDEGVYIQQALLVLDGQLPYRDFFYHQTPLYLFTLAAFAAPAPDSLFVYRLLSALATSACGFVVYRIALRLTSKPGAFLAALLFLTAPLQFYGLLALPNALMLTFSTVGVLLIFWHTRPALVALGAVLLVVSILYKPLSLATAAAIGLALLVGKDQRRKVGRVLTAAALAGACAWGLFHLSSEGRFSQLLELQLSRYSGKSGFEIMSEFERFRVGRLEPLGITTAMGFNLDEHANILLSYSDFSSTSHLAALAVCGQILLLCPYGRRWRAERALLTLWWIVPLLFSIFVWEPSWDHYFVQYLPAFAILASLFVVRAWNVSRRRTAARVALVVALIFTASAGPLHMILRRTELTDLAPEGAETWLTFDPFLNHVTGTKPGCDLIDPFNVYDTRSLIATSPTPVWAPFRVSVDDVIDCLEYKPETKVAVQFWGSWFIAEPLRGYLDELPLERFAFAPQYFDPSLPAHALGGVDGVVVSPDERADEADPH